MSKNIVALKRMAWAVVLIMLGVLKYGIELTFIWVPALFVLLLPAPIVIEAMRIKHSKSLGQYASKTNLSFLIVVSIYVFSILGLVLQCQFQILHGALLGSIISILVGLLLYQKS